jgi:hypothetical protein
MAGFTFSIATGRADDVITLALRRLELVEQFLVGADAGEVDLDAGLVHHRLGEAFRQVVRPHHDVDLARGREGLFHVEGADGRDGTRGGGALDDRTAREGLRRKLGFDTGLY